MGFLAPIFLLAAAALAVPLALHLFQRRDPRRVPFPAIRYLQRAERDHARSIRFRQLLLLALRLLAVLLLVGAGARLYLETGSSSHEPTALALVLDNSLSSGLVQDDRRTLDRLKDRALESLEAAGADDRIWVIRAGEPWDLARPLGVEEARERVRATEPSPAGGDLMEAIRRGASLVRGSGLPAAEIQLLSDLQDTGFPEDGPLALEGDLTVVVLVPRGEPPVNRWVSGIQVGGGLPPLAGKTADVVVGVDARPTSEDSLTIRLTVGERVRGATLAVPGSRAVIPAGPFDEGTVTGRAEIDPDALRADDRRHFAFRVRPPPRVRVTEEAGEGPGPDFLGEALAVLEEGERIRLVQEAGSAQILLSRGGLELAGLADGAPALVVPPSDPTLLPALNRRLARSGIPVELRARAGSGEGEARLEATDLVPELEGVRVYRHYDLRTTGPVDGARPRVMLVSGEPWLVAGEGGTGPYLVLASSLDPEATNLPVSAAMIPFLEWALSSWSAGAAGPESLTVGAPLPRLPGATGVEGPDGTLRPLDGTGAPPEARIPGVYTIRRGDTALDVVAVNPPTSESDLTRTRPARLRTLVGPGLVTVDDPSAWSRQIFRHRKGPELWRPLLVLALLVLLAESLVGAGGGRTTTNETVESDPTSTRARV